MGWLSIVLSVARDAYRTSTSIQLYISTEATYLYLCSVPVELYLNFLAV